MQHESTAIVRYGDVKVDVTGPLGPQQSRQRGLRLDVQPVPTVVAELPGDAIASRMMHSDVDEEA